MNDTREPSSPAPRPDRPPKRDKKGYTPPPPPRRPKPVSKPKDGEKLK
jgi:hypothetical protein